MLQEIFEASGIPGANATAVPTATITAFEQYNGPEQTLSVACNDAPNPTDPAVYTAWAEQRAALGPLGVSQIWNDLPCAFWPVKAPGRYAGPWDNPTPSILVVGNTHDPSTPYANSLAMVDELANGHLLTVDGYGHTALLNGSSCALAAMDAYFIDGTLPADGTVCAEDAPPFAVFAAAPVGVTPAFTG